MHRKVKQRLTENEEVCRLEGHILDKKLRCKRCGLTQQELPFDQRSINERNSTATDF